MREYVITTDSTADLPLEYYEAEHVFRTPLTYEIEGVVYRDMEGITSKEFYEKVRNGAMPTTSQLNPEQAKEAFLTHVKDGKDILHISFSSGLSGSYNSAKIAASEIMEEHQGTNIMVVDSLCASMGQGLLVYQAVEKKKEGLGMDELAKWLEEIKLHLCHVFTVDDLNHLHRGGRVSKATAVIGTMINIKPILHVDDEGHLIPIDKVRGRKKSLAKLVERMMTQIQGFEEENKKMIMLSHGDCEDDVNYVKKVIYDRLGYEHIMVNSIGPVIGAHSGPGTVALFFIGRER